jgi:hypothetical protein
VGLFSHKTIEYLNGKSFGNEETVSGILELEEENGSSEESKEEKDEESKFEDNFFDEVNHARFSENSEHLIFIKYQHYIPADYSSQLLAPPELS